MVERSPSFAEEMVHRQEKLHAAIEVISGELEWNALPARIVRAACDLLDAEVGAFRLVNEDEGGRHTADIYGDAAGSEQASFVAGTALFDHLFHTQKPLLFDRYTDFAHATQSPFSAYAVVGVPIFREQQQVGGLVLGAPPPRRFQQQDVELLSLLARHVAVAVTNAGLFTAQKRRAARHAAINRIGKLIAGSLSLDELLQTAVVALSEELHHTNAAILLVDRDEPETLVLLARSGIYAQNVQGEYRQGIYEGIIGSAARARQPVLIADVGQDPRYIPIPGAEDIRSELALPIILGEQLLGVLNVESTQPLTVEDAAALEVVADQLGVAIENAYLFAGTQRSLREAQLLYETSRRISIAMNVDGVIMAYLEQVAVRGRYICSVVLYEFNEEGERSAVLLLGRWTPEEGMELMHEKYPYSRDDLDPPLDAGQTVTIRDVHTDPRASPELRAIQSASGRPALAMIPLMVHGLRIGLVILSYSTVYEWPVADLWPYQVTAAQLAAAIYARRQQLLLYESGQEVAVLRERQHLARELHDSVTQLIFSMTLIAQSIAPAWERDPQQGQQRVNRLLELSQAALAEMRALLFELRSSETPSTSESAMTLPGIVHLKRDGLVAALERHITIAAREGPQIHLNAAGYQAQSPDHEIALYRITQEALNNIAKHAQAQQVYIELFNEDGFTHLRVKDDGVGFEPEKAESGRSPSSPNTSAQSGLGLRTMQERAEALGGTIQINSNPGQGTEVRVRLPQNQGG